MRLRNVPVAKLGGLISVKTEVDSQFYAGHSCLIQFQIGGRVVNRIAAEDYQQVYSAPIDVADKFLKRLPLIYWVGFERIRVKNGLTHITKRIIHRVREGMDHRRCLFARNHET